jgi:BASS family bile acid:Na+ symporter
MRRIKGLFRNRNFIMILALVLGMVWDGGAFLAKDTILPFLAIIMTLSTMGITAAAFRSFGGMVGPALAGVLASYVYHGGILLLLNAFFIRDNNFSTGFILLAAVPPAVAVIPFSFFLKGDSNFALIGTIGAYLGALVVTPLIAVAFLGSGFISPVKVFVILIELIIAPLILSRILIKMGLARRIEPVKGTIINWSFFVLVYTITGLNRTIILQNPLSLVWVTLIALFSMFVLGWIIERAGNALRIDSKVLTSMILLGTYKNYGLASGLSLVFFNPETAVPATVTSTISILYIIYLEMRKKGEAAQ